VVRIVIAAAGISVDAVASWVVVTDFRWAEGVMPATLIAAIGRPVETASRVSKLRYFLTFMK
jgi:hypothetical protein